MHISLSLHVLPFAAAFIAHESNRIQFRFVLCCVESDEEMLQLVGTFTRDQGAHSDMRPTC